MCSVLCVHMDPRVQARRVDSGFKAKLLAIINKQQSFAKVEGGEDLTWGGGGGGGGAGGKCPSLSSLYNASHSAPLYHVVLLVKCRRLHCYYTRRCTYIHTYSLLCSPIHMALMTHRDTCCQQSDATNQC